MFSCVCGPSVCPLWRTVYLGPLPLLSWIICCFHVEPCEFFMYFGCQPFIGCIISKRLLPFGRLLFVLLIVSLAGQKLFSLTLYHLLIFASVALALGDISTNIMLKVKVRSSLLGFFSRSFVVSGVTCKSLINFVFISVYGVR